MSKGSHDKILKIRKKRCKSTFIRWPETRDKGERCIGRCTFVFKKNYFYEINVSRFTDYG